MKVDVHVTHAVTEEALRLPTGAYYMGRGEYELWVKQGDKIMKRKVNLGESGFENVEVIAGLEEGEEVVISDMGRYREREVLTIK